MQAWNLKRDVFPIVFVALFGILTIYFYPLLPASVPSHFNFHGAPDNFTSKAGLISIMGGTALILYLLITFIPLIDPFRKKIEAKYEIFLICRNIILFFTLFMYVVMIFSALRGSLQGNAMGMAFGLFFILIGNYMPKLPRNFFVGIRTPWTLASEEVWKKSHVLGGWLFVAGGITMVLLSLFNVPLEYSLTGVIVPVVVVSGIIYPFLLYKKIDRTDESNVPQL